MLAPFTGITLLMLSVNALAMDSPIFRCHGSQGEAFFSQTPCGKKIEPVEIGVGSWINGAQMKQRSLQQLQRIQQLPSPTVPRTAPRPDLRLSYAERAQLRKLTMEADGLRRDLDRAGSGARRRELERELNQKAEQIQRLQRRR